MNYMNRILTWVKKHSTFLISLFFAAYFVLGISITPHYGVSTDEPTEHETSLRQYKFAVSKVYFTFTGEQVPQFEESHVWYQNMLQETRDRNYGTFLQWPTMVIEHFYNFTLELPTIYLLRHFLNFMYFVIALICFFALLHERFKNKWLALLGVTIVILTPRFFAESFYNNKDILLASIYIVAIYFSQKFWKQKSILNAVLASVTCALAMNTRVLAIIVPLGFWLLIFVDTLSLKWKIQQNRMKNLLQLLLVIAFPIATFIFFILSHPTSWGRELIFLPEVFAFFSQYTSWTGSTMYFGEMVPYNQLPWHFTLGYFVATTPIVYVLLLIWSLILFCHELIQRTVQSKIQDWWKNLITLDTVMLGLWLAPLAAVIVFQSVLYNSWRHMYFIYFPFVYFMIWGVNFAQKYPRFQKGILLSIAVSFFVTGHWMFKNHPNQFMYFSPLVRSGAAENFERDYWQLSFLPLSQEMLRLEQDTSEKITLWEKDAIHNHIKAMTTVADRERFEFVPNEADAEYAVVHYYNTKERAPWQVWYILNDVVQKREVDNFEIVKEVSVDGFPLATLLRKKQ